MDDTPGKQEFIEEMALLMEGLGFPRMAGRIHAALLVAEPPEQTAEQLAEMVQASRGAISGATRLLVSLNFIERLSKPGERRDYFRVRPGAWTKVGEQELHRIAVLRRLVEKGLKTIQSDDPEARRGALEMLEYLDFWAENYPRLFELWKETRQRKQRGGEAP